MTRAIKNIFGLILLAGAVMSLPAAPEAQAASEARLALETTVNSVLKELQDPNLKDPAKNGPVLERIEDTVRRLFDFGELSARTVGPSWRSFSPDQQARFTSAFENLLRETYLEKLVGYNGEQVLYTGETASAKGDKVEIKTTVTVKEKPVLVSYRMLKKQQWVVYDVIIEGVSMVQNYRTQFQELLAKGDAEALIKRVQDKAVEMRNHNQQQQTA